MAEHIAMSGVIDLGEGLTAVDIWQGLHANARHWSDVDYGQPYSQDHILIDGTDLSVLKALKNYPADKWYSLCSAVGWTVYGAVALSWCEGAQLEQVWEGWETSGFQIKTSPEFERPARFINQKVLPKTNNMHELVVEAKNKALPFCAMMVAKRDTLVYDLKDKDAKSASPQIAAFLLAHMRHGSEMSKKHKDLIEIWKNTVQGTEWDI